MLGATYHIAAEIGSNPLAWVGPFGLYLLSFMLTFSGRWRRWMTMTAIVFLAVTLTMFMVKRDFHCGDRQWRHRVVPFRPHRQW